MCVFSLNFSSACFVCAHKIRKIHNSRREFLRLKFKFEMFRLLFMIFKRMKQKKNGKEKKKNNFLFRQEAAERKVQNRTDKKRQQLTIINNNTTTATCKINIKSTAEDFGLILNLAFSICVLCVAVWYTVYCFRFSFFFSSFSLFTFGARLRCWFADI